MGITIHSLNDFESRKMRTEETYRPKAQKKNSCGLTENSLQDALLFASEMNTVPQGRA